MKKHHEQPTGDDAQQPSAAQHAVDGAPPDDGNDLAPLRAERDELIDHLQRLQAEFENFRKRTEREQQEASRYAADGLLHEILQISDAYSLALEHLPKDLHQDVYQGLLLVKDQLHKLLADNGLAPMCTDGERFDPQLHEALMTVDGDGKPKGTIIQTFQRGYTRDGKAFRAARVSVAK